MERRQPDDARWPSAGELVLAGAFAVIGVLLTTDLLDGLALAAALALTVVHSGSVAWRRRSPETVLAVQGGTAAIAVAAGWPPVMLGPAAVATLHGLGATRPRRQAVPLVAAAVAVMAVVVLAGGAGIDTVVGNAVALGAAWWLGDRWRRTGERAERAERLAQDAVSAERLRIARELHDVVAHALSVIAVQAGTGRVVLDADVETARAALSSIETESRTALGEMRRLLEVLRDDDGTAALAPSPGLDDLDGLVAATVRSGLSVEVRIEGERTPMPAGAELAAYRIVQEALTNARKHAHASRVEVTVRWRPESVEIEVLDDGDGSAASSASHGHGLIGMRERAALYGGRVVAGDRAGRGFRVAAHIPTGPA